MSEDRLSGATGEKIFRCDKCKVSWWHVLPLYKEEMERLSEGSDKCPCCLV